MDFKEVAKHNTGESCWVILYDNVYDVRTLTPLLGVYLTEKVTDFLPAHPGGPNIILKLAGSDATAEYDPVHPPGTLEEHLPPTAKLGPIDPQTVPAKPSAEPATTEPPPALSTLLNLDDIEAAATKLLAPKAWAYYYSAGDDLVSKSLNNTVYRSILLRPRIFVDCTSCSTATTVLGHDTKLPVFVAPAAQARLAHPSGEHGIAQACATFGAVQVISYNASMTPEQILEGAPPDQVFGWQIYVANDRRKSEAMIARVNALPQIKFIVLTLDAPVPGNREHDERAGKVNSALTAADEPKAAGGIGTALFLGTATDLTWKTTLPWLAEHTKLPIMLKGVQTHEDAYMASLYTPQVQGIVLSNHGGRAADTAPPAMHTLMEIRKYCPEVLGKLEVYVDGGIKRGTDVVKALCLGARGVGIGRAPLYGLGVGGKEGVERVLEILKAEIKTCMRLLGVERVDQLGLQHINARALEQQIYDGPATFERLSLWVKSKL